MKRWNLEPIYQDLPSWEAERAGVDQLVAKLDALQGRLGESAEIMAQALDLAFQIQRVISRLYTYASLKADTDLRESEPQGLRQKVESQMSQIGARTAWIEPEILSLPDGTVARFLEQAEQLSGYRRYLEKLERRRPYTLDPSGEKLMSLAGLIRGDGHTMHGLLCDTEIPWPTIELAAGETLRCDYIGYSRGRMSSVREDRKKIYDAFFGELGRFTASLATSLHATVKEHVFEMRARSYDSCVQAALHGNEIDPVVYYTLVDEVREGLGVLHDFQRIRRHALGVSELQYYDLHVPLSDEDEKSYAWQAACDQVLESVAPLGDAYVDELRAALSGGWIDVAPHPGKRSGAYVNDGAYGVHPYMLLNHQDDFRSTSTLAHEAGHLMHSLRSQRTQPYPTARYSIFVAEVASTLNEQLLFEGRYQHAASSEEKIGLLGHHLDTLRATVFRQTMFAEFELRIHELAEQGQPLTADSLTELFLKLLRDYHGDPGENASSKPVVRIAPEFAVEWAFIPHFHYNFYVYQYATSYVAATALSRKILAGDDAAREAYLTLLGSGSAKPPVELLRDAGVDMATPDPIRATVAAMDEANRRLDDLIGVRS